MVCSDMGVWASDLYYILIRQVTSGQFALSNMASSEVSQYEPKPSLKYAATVGLQAAVIGAFVSTIQNALGSHSHGAAGFLTRTGGTIGFFGTFPQAFLL